MMLEDRRTANSWNNFRRAIYGEDRDAFDSMTAKAKSHATTAGSSNLDPMEAILLSILLEQEKEIRLMLASTKH